MIFEDFDHAPSVLSFRSFGPLLTAAAFVFMGAGIVYAQVAQGSGERAEQFRQAGLAQVTSGQIDEGIASFKNGLEIEPQNAKLLDAAGGAYSLKNDMETARRYFVESLKVDSASVSTRQNLGITLFSLGRYEEASKQFSRIQQVPGRPREAASLFLGLIAHRQGNCKDAVPHLKASGSLLNQYSDALLSYSECEYQLGDAANANAGLAAFEKLAEKTVAESQRAANLHSRIEMNVKTTEDPNTTHAAAAVDARIVLEQAHQFEKANRLDEAQALLERETSSRATFELVFELATVAKERGDLATAMKSLRRASQIEPGREESYLEFSTICADHSNDQLALDTAEIGLEHVPDSYRLTVQKGAVQEKLGHLNDAEATLRKAIGMEKDNSVALLSLAIVQAHSGRPNEAEQTLASAIRQFPENYYMYYFQGKLLMQFGVDTVGSPDRKDAARRSLEEAIRLNPDYPDSYYQLSDLYVTDSPKLAEQALEKCLKLDPHHSAAQYALARLYVRTGRKQEGEAVFARLKTQQRSEEVQQQKQILIGAAEN
jgi:tetratricopeptide (TPR) repeat protein